MIIDHQTINARVKAFDEENGKDSICIGDWRVYSNGARREIDPMGCLADPPENDYERNTIIVSYWEERLRRASTAFKDLKAHYIGHARGAMSEPVTPHPIADPEEAVRKLKTLQLEVYRCQRDLRKAKAALTASTPKQFAKRQEALATRRQMNSELLSAVEKIKL